MNINSLAVGITALSNLSKNQKMRIILFINPNFLFTSIMSIEYSYTTGRHDRDRCNGLLFYNFIFLWYVAVVMCIQITRSDLTIFKMNNPLHNITGNKLCYIHFRSHVLYVVDIVVSLHQKQKRWRRWWWWAGDQKKRSNEAKAKKETYNKDTAPCHLV